MGHGELRDIDAGMRPESGRSKARIGPGLGIVATVVYGLGLILFLVALSTVHS